MSLDKIGTEYESFAYLEKGRDYRASRHFFSLRTVNDRRTKRGARIRSIPGRRNRRSGALPGNT